MDDEIVIRDVRKKEKFQLDDEYLNGYARLCGIFSTGVYNCLCRHADFNTQKCFPSIKTIAYKLGISEASVKRGIKGLVDWNIIIKERSRHPENAKWVNNSYILLDKSIWKTKPQLCETSGSHSSVGTKPQLCGDESHSSVAPRKVTHTKVTHTKEVVATATPFFFEEEIQKLKDGIRKDYKIIALYWKMQGFVFENKEQFNENLGRELRPAKVLKGYTGEQISRAMSYCKNNYKETGWTLETCGKRIALIVNIKK